MELWVMKYHVSNIERGSGRVGERGRRREMGVGRDRGERDRRYREGRHMEEKRREMERGGK